MAGVVCCTSEGSVYLLLSEVLRLKECNPLLQGRAGNRRVLENCKDSQKAMCGRRSISRHTRDLELISICGDNVDAEALTADVIKSSRTIFAIFYALQVPYKTVLCGGEDRGGVKGEDGRVAMPT